MDKELLDSSSFEGLNKYIDIFLYRYSEINAYQVSLVISDSALIKDEEGRLSYIKVNPVGRNKIFKNVKGARKEYQELLTSASKIEEAYKVVHNFIY